MALVPTSSTPNQPSNDPSGPPRKSANTVLSLWRGVLEVRHFQTMGEILADVAAASGVAVAVLRGPSQCLHISRPRQQFMAEAHATGRYSLPTIGRFLGGRDHTTILHGVRAYRARLAQTSDQAAA